MLVSKTIPGCFGGISQIVPELRKVVEVEDMENCYTNIAYGTTNRPKINKLITLPFSNSDNFSQTINHLKNGVVKDYLYIINSNNLYIYNLSDSILEATITDNYFIGINKNTGRMLSVGGDVYILNTTKVIGIDTSKTSDSPTEYNKMFYIKRGVNPGKYTIKNGANYVKASVPARSDGNSVSLTDDIATSLYIGANAGDVNYSGYTGGLAALNTGTEEQSGSIIYFLNSTDLSGYIIEDSLGNNAIGLINGKVSSFNELPGNIKHQTTIEITGEIKDNNTSYYVEFVDNSWKETYKKTYIGDAEIYRGFNGSDMPRKITNNGAGTFTNNVINFDSRTVGNDENNPMPLFVNSKINDMFIFQNRLCLLSNNGVSFSEIGKFNNFFRKTVRTILNFEAFSFKVEITNGLNLLHGVPYNEGVILFDKNNQYTLSASQVIGSNDIFCAKSTSYKVNDTIKPITINNNLIFTNNKGNNSTIYKYITAQNLVGNKGIEVSSNVPSLIGKNISFISGVNLYNLTMFGNGDNNVYLLDNSGGDNEYSWTRWKFGINVKNIHNLSSDRLYITSSNCVYYMDLNKLGGSKQFGIYDTNLTEETDSGTYTYEPYVILSKRYEPTEFNNVLKPYGNYRLKRLNFGSFKDIKIIVSDGYSSDYESNNNDLLNRYIDLQSELRNTQIKIVGKNSGFYFTSLAIDLEYTDPTTNKN